MVLFRNFPVEEFAKWLDKPIEAVTGLCIDMASKGFIYYDRTNNEITIKKKTKDFLDSYAKRRIMISLISSVRRNHPLIMPSLT